MTDQSTWDNYFKEHPLDWGGHGVYADWLEEQGHPDAAFHRWLLDTHPNFVEFSSHSGWPTAGATHYIERTPEIKDVWEHLPLHWRHEYTTPEDRIVGNVRARTIASDPHTHLDRLKLAFEAKQLGGPTPSEVWQSRDETRRTNRVRPLKRQYAKTFASPNTDVGLDFDSAVQRLKSKNQEAFKEVSKQVLNTLGLKPHTIHDAIGDWQDGAENSVVHSVDEPVDQDTARYAAAWMGLLADQKAVLQFHEDDKGPDSLYEVHAPDPDLDKVRKSLDAAGIKYRTIIPSEHGATVLVFDAQRQLRPNISHFAGMYNAVIRESPGHGEFVGDNSDPASKSVARANYRHIIEQYESGHATPYRPDSGPSGSVSPQAEGQTPDTLPPGPEGSQGPTNAAQTQGQQGPVRNRRRI